MLLSTKCCLSCDVGQYESTFNRELIFSNLESPLLCGLLSSHNGHFFLPPSGQKFCCCDKKLSSGKAPTTLVFTNGLIGRFLTTSGSVLHSLWPANLLFPKAGSSVIALL